MDAAFAAVPSLHPMAMPPQDGVQAGWRVPRAAVWHHTHKTIWEFPSKTHSLPSSAEFILTAVKLKLITPKVIEIGYTK